MRSECESFGKHVDGMRERERIHPSEDLDTSNTEIELALKMTHFLVP